MTVGANVPVKLSEAELVEKREKIVLYATDVFLRYGHARTTMQDIADAAAISRPALYLLFPGKREIFAAVISTMIAARLAEYRAALPRLKTTARRLHFCMERWSGVGYEIVFAHPDARDVFDLSFPPVRAMYKELENFLGEIVRAEVESSKLKISPEEFARLLIFSLRGVKETANDAKDMRRLISITVDIALRSLRAP